MTIEGLERRVLEHRYLTGRIDNTQERYGPQASIQSRYITFWWSDPSMIVTALDFIKHNPIFKVL